MIKLEYSLTNYKELLRYIAKGLGLKITDQTVSFKESIGEGTIKELSFDNGLQVLLYNYTPKDKILFKQVKTNNEVFTLRFDDINLNNSTSLNKASVFLASSKYEGMMLVEPGFHVKSINIAFTSEWLNEFLNYDEAGEMLKKYIALKMGAYIYEPLDAEYRRLMQEVFEAGRDKRFEKICIQNRIVIMIERFLTRLYKKTSDANFNVNLSHDDILRLKQAEAALIKDFSFEAPTINQLARIAAMSPSKLKASFKKIYGLPVYQYYQKQRMIKAKAMLLSKKYSLSEIAEEVGFTGTHNFTKAYKKMFDQLPERITAITDEV